MIVNSIKYRWLFINNNDNRIIFINFFYQYYCIYWKRDYFNSNNLKINGITCCYLNFVSLLA